VPQAEAGVTYAHKIDKAETRLDFTQSAAAVLRQINAFNPPGVWFEHAGERVRVLSAETHAGAGSDAGTVIDDGLAIACADDAIRPTRVQRAGRGIVTTRELLNGFPIPAGTRL
jgi:methionyl-tRNA formyltransferase